MSVFRLSGSTGGVGPLATFYESVFRFSSSTGDVGPFNVLYEVNFNFNFDKKIKDRTQDYHFHFGDDCLSLSSLYKFTFSNERNEGYKLYYKPDLVAAGDFSFKAFHYTHFILLELSFSHTSWLFSYGQDSGYTFRNVRNNPYGFFIVSGAEIFKTVRLKL